MSCISGEAKLVRIKRNDTLPTLKITVLERDPNNPNIKIPVDLTGATARFHMVTDDDSRTVVIDADATITDAEGGVVEYQWIGSDTDTSGHYLGEFELTLVGGILTLPADDTLKIQIVDDYA